jgi:hypothetical protein
VKRKQKVEVDFIINGKPLTDTQKQEISAFIKADKERLAKLKKRGTKSRNSIKTSSNKVSSVEK